VISEVRKKLWSLAMTGETIKQVAAHLGISASALKQRYRREGLKWPGRKVQMMMTILQSSITSSADAQRIRFLLRSAPWHQFKFDTSTQEAIETMRQRAYKHAYRDKSV
jgi:transposase-like protein